ETLAQQVGLGRPPPVHGRPADAGTHRHVGGPEVGLAIGEQGEARLAHLPAHPLTAAPRSNSPARALGAEGRLGHCLLTIHYVLLGVWTSSESRPTSPPTIWSGRCATTAPSSSRGCCRPTCSPA